MDNEDFLKEKIEYLELLVSSYKIQINNYEKIISNSNAILHAIEEWVDQDLLDKIAEMTMDLTKDQ